jgi:hypothetical protein
MLVIEFKTDSILSVLILNGLMVFMLLLFINDYYFDHDVYQETNFRNKFYQLSTINDVYRYVDYYINQLRPKMLL